MLGRTIEDRRAWRAAHPAWPKGWVCCRFVPCSSLPRSCALYARVVGGVEAGGLRDSPGRTDVERVLPAFAELPDGRTDGVVDGASWAHIYTAYSNTEAVAAIAVRRMPRICAQHLRRVGLVVRAKRESEALRGAVPVNWNTPRGRGARSRIGRSALVAASGPWHRLADRDGKISYIPATRPAGVLLWLVTVGVTAGVVLLTPLLADLTGSIRSWRFRDLDRHAMAVIAALPDLPVARERLSWIVAATRRTWMNETSCAQPWKRSPKT
jgi:hypothetical protein